MPDVIERLIESIQPGHLLILVPVALVLLVHLYARSLYPKSSEHSVGE